MAEVYAIEMLGITKKFGNILANDKIDSVEATNYTIDNICCAFIKFSQEDFEFYTIQQDEDIIL